MNKGIKKPAGKSFPAGSGFAVNVKLCAPTCVLLEPVYG